MRFLNADLAFFDDQSDFSGSISESISPKPSAHNYSPDANRSFLAKPTVSRIVMNGEEPKFGGSSSPDKSPKAKAPQARLPASPDVNLSLKASNTLKLL